MLIISAKEIEKLCSPHEVIQAVTKAFQVQESGNYLMPARMHIENKNDVLLLMPAFADDYFSTKLVSVFPGNIKLGKPAIYGNVVLNNVATGEPLALIEGAILTAVRTGSVGAIGIKYTTPENASKLGLIGAGIQGFRQVVFACAVRDFTEVHVFDPFNDQLDNFIDKLKDHLPGVAFYKSDTVESLLLNSETIITATTAETPVIPDQQEELLNGKHFIGIGSYKPEMREFPDGLFRLVNHVIVDTDHATKESGDLSIPLDKRLFKKEKIFRLGQIINNEVKINTDKTTFFKSVGMALFDLYTSIMIYEKALEKGLGTEVVF